MKCFSIEGKGSKQETYNGILNLQCAIYNKAFKIKLSLKYSSELRNTCKHIKGHKSSINLSIKPLWFFMSVFLCSHSYLLWIFNLKKISHMNCRLPCHSGLYGNLGVSSFTLWWLHIPSRGVLTHALQPDCMASSAWLSWRQGNARYHFFIFFFSRL